MTTHSGQVDAPPATRSRLPGWRDPRLWVGLVLVAGAVVLGARVLASAEETTAVWSAADDLAAGSVIGADDLIATEVRFADPEQLDGYLPVADGVPEGRLRAPVARGELIGAGALGAEATGYAEVAIWAPTLAVPPAVDAGSVVDIWVSDPEVPGVAAAPLLDDVAVVAAPRSDDGFGAGAERQVVVAVPSDDEARIGALLAAAQAGHVAISKDG